MSAAPEELAGPKFREKKNRPPPIIACASKAEVESAVAVFVRPGDSAVVLGAELGVGGRMRRSRTRSRAAGADAPAVRLLDVLRKAETARARRPAARTTRPRARPHPPRCRDARAARADGGARLRRRRRLRRAGARPRVGRRPRHGRRHARAEPRAPQPRGRVACSSSAALAVARRAGARLVADGRRSPLPPGVARALPQYAASGVPIPRDDPARRARGRRSTRGRRALWHDDRAARCGRRRRRRRRRAGADVATTSSRCAPLAAATALAVADAWRATCGALERFRACRRPSDGAAAEDDDGPLADVVYVDAGGLGYTVLKRALLRASARRSSRAPS